MRLPEGWLDLDPREPDLLAELREATARQWPERQPDERVAHLLGPLLVELRGMVARADVLVVGVYADTVPVAGSPDPLLVTANVTLALSPVMTTPDADALLADFGSADGVIVESVALPAGRAVRLATITELDNPDWERPVPALLRRYLLPVPALSRVAVLTFLSPNLELADAFDVVFAAVANTVRFDVAQSSA